MAVPAAKAAEAACGGGDGAGPALLPARPPRPLFCGRRLTSTQLMKKGSRPACGASQPDGGVGGGDGRRDDEGPLPVGREDLRVPTPKPEA